MEAISSLNKEMHAAAALRQSRTEERMDSFATKLDECEERHNLCQERNLKLKRVLDKRYRRYKREIETLKIKLKLLTDEHEPGGMT